MFFLHFLFILNIIKKQNFLFFPLLKREKNGNPLKKAVLFKNGERVSKDWALKNAKAHYDKCAKERKEALDKRHPDYDQDELDSLVSASGGTSASRQRLESYVFSNWSNKDSISKFMSTFATTAAGNHGGQPGLVIRRKFESNWFIGVHKPYRVYQEEYYREHPRKNKRRK